MKHQFEGYREPGTANGPGESYSYCVNCCAEETDENRDDECVLAGDAKPTREFLGVVKSVCRVEYGRLPGVNGFGIGDGVVRAYVTDEQAKAQLPSEKLGVPLEFVITGVIRFLGGVL